MKLKKNWFNALFDNCPKGQGYKHLLAAVESLIFFPSREAKCCSKASRRLLGACKERHWGIHLKKSIFKNIFTECSCRATGTTAQNTSIPLLAFCMYLMTWKYKVTYSPHYIIPSQWFISKDWKMSRNVKINS